MPDYDEEQYDADYFESGINSNYNGYIWRPELLLPRIEAIIKFIDIPSNAKILDYGCAKGFYVKVFRELGYQADGIEISKYAISQAPEDMREHLSHVRNRTLSSMNDLSYDLTIAKDVLEHLQENELIITLQELRRVSRQVLITVPVINNKGEYINVDDSLDKTHRLKYSRKEWLNILQTQTSCDNLCLALKGRKAVGTLCAIVTHNAPTKKSRL